MKFTSLDERGNRVTVKVFWSDHRQGCEKCQAVDIERTDAVANVCAIGAPLLNEELAKLRAPVVKQKNKEVADWADKAGVFIKPRVKDPHTKYVEPE